MRIATQMRCIIFILLGFALLNISVLYFQINRMNGNARTINLNGVIRGASQKAVKLSLVGQYDDRYIQTIDRIFQGFLEGSQSLKIPVIKDPELVQKNQELQISWKELKLLLENPQNHPEHKQELIAASEEFWELANLATETAQNLADRNVGMLKLLQFILFIANILVLGIIWFLIQKISKNLQSTVDNVVVSTKEIACVIEEQERVAVQQIKVVNETTDVMEQLQSSSHQVSEQARMAKNIADRVMELATEGCSIVQINQQDITHLKTQVENIAQQIHGLDEQTNQVGYISDLMSDLAQQTNMLSLNAAIESVRGETEGRGFTVIASEIRQLADQSKQAAQRINQLVLDIKKAMKKTVLVTQMGTQSLSKSVAKTQQTVGVFEEVTQVINNVVVSSEHMLLNAKQQADAAQQVLETMHELENAAEETKLGMNYALSSTQRLNLATQLLHEIT